MRLGVLDVGSNTVHLLVVDAHPGARPLPAYSHKEELRLAEMLEGDAITRLGAERLEQIIAQALVIAEDKGVGDMLAFATSAVREAVNGEQVIGLIRDRTGIDLQVLSGEDEARLTFLAVRRWYGWSAGRLLVLDIGGGSLEVGTGIDEDPDAVCSLPLGAGRLTRAHLIGDPPSSAAVRGLRKYVRASIAGDLRGIIKAGANDRAVATSKTFRQLARITGSAPAAEGSLARRRLRHADLIEWLPRLSRMTVSQRAGLPGVSSGRAGQLLAGALVADAAMDLLRVEELEICPWALREGIILRRLDAIRHEALGWTAPR
jgi:exopolyphosphatase/guanosine-5'-triphosphate,3'-diphosphate pyrophosphatase